MAALLVTHGQIRVVAPKTLRKNQIFSNYKI